MCVTRFMQFCVEEEVVFRGQAVTKATITRWVRDVMRESGISDDLFTAYSVQSPSTSKACRAGMAWESRKKATGWRRESTFIKHYKKTILSMGAFGKIILHSYTNK